MLIGITGGIGCGKSVVLKLLGELLDAPGYSSDDICRELLMQGRAGYREFVRRFGPEFLDESGSIDRQKVRDRIFSDETSRVELESILHPLVRQRIIDEHRNIDGAAPVLAEVPLLFECGWEQDFDSIVCVVAPRELLIERIIARDGGGREDAMRIIGAQMSVDDKAARSDWVIHNDGDFSHVSVQATRVAGLIRELCGKGERGKNGQKA